MPSFTESIIVIGTILALWYLRQISNNLRKHWKVMEDLERKKVAVLMLIQKCAKRT